MRPLTEPPTAGITPRANVDADRSHPPTEAPAPAEIEVSDLHRTFGANAVLRGIDLTVRRGEIVAIVGGSGCGKSVLLQHIIGHFLPDRGVVRVADHESPGAPLRDLATLEEPQLDRIRLHWAVVFQRNALFSGTVLENIAFWLRENRGLSEREIEPIAMDALRSVGFRDPAALMRRDRDALSGGMAKRVAIARAIAMDPILCFYDEPTSGLDPSLAAQIHELIFALHERPARGAVAVPRTTLVITHDKDMLQRLRPRVIMLHDGRVHFDGPYGAFGNSTSEIIRPYFALMPALQSIRRPGSQ